MTEQEFYQKLKELSENLMISAEVCMDDPAYDPFGFSIMASFDELAKFVGQNVASCYLQKARAALSEKP